MTGLLKDAVTMHVARTLLARLALVGAAFAAAAASPATAAVRDCKPPVLGDVVEAAREVDARRMALDAWKRRVAPLGKPYENWRIATEKRLACKPTVSNTHRCAAYAAPCTVKQNPRARPRPARPAPAVGKGIIEV
ncbi:MAG: hypothetical protein ACK4MF_01295 [Hyphomicrobiaceae bacterium]